MNAPSSSSNFSFLFIPPAYPVNKPFEPITLWHGIIIKIGFLETAPPMA